MSDTPHKDFKTHPLWQIWDTGQHSASQYRESLGDVLVQWEELKAENVQLSSQKEELQRELNKLDALQVRQLLEIQHWHKMSDTFASREEELIRQQDEFRLVCRDVDQMENAELVAGRQQIAELQREKKSLTQQLQTQAEFIDELDAGGYVRKYKARIEALEQALAVIRAEYDQKVISHDIEEKDLKAKLAAKEREKKI